MKAQDDIYTIYPRITKLILYLLGCLGFIVLGIFSLDYIFVLGLISIIVFGFFLLCYIYLLIIRKPSLIIHSKYFVDHASMIGVGKINWEEVKVVHLFEYYGQKMIGIETYDPDYAIKHTRGYKKWLLKINRLFIPFFITIPQNTLSISIEECHDLMQQQLQNFQQNINHE